METTSYKNGYFPVQNAIFDTTLSSNAKLAYAYLSKCADRFGKSWPSHKRMAEACSISVTEIKNVLRELVNIKLITVSSKYRTTGGKSSNVYMVMDKGYSNCFWVNADIFLKTISAKAKIVYLFFSRSADREKQCFPAHKTTATKCNMALSTCRRAIKELIDNLLIVVQPRVRDNNGQTSNLYKLVKLVVEKVDFVASNVVNTAKNTQSIKVSKLAKKPLTNLLENIRKSVKNDKLLGRWASMSRGHRQQ